MSVRGRVVSVDKRRASTIHFVLKSKSIQTAHAADDRLGEGKLVFYLFGAS
jgi:hypothetical protein